MSRFDTENQSTVSKWWEPGDPAGGRKPMAPIRAAAYIRVSSDSDDQENSYEAQERYFSGILQGNPMIENAGIYFDHGISGTDLDRRTGFKRLLRHCEEGKIDRIICKSISRFARNTKDFVETLQRLKKANVSVYFETPGFDTADRSADFVLSTLAAIAEEESRSLSQNVLDGLEHHYKMGEVGNCDIYGYRFNGGTAVAKTGYRYREVELVESEAEVVRRIFHSVENGKPFAHIARELNSEGIPAPKRHPKASWRQGRLKDGLDEGWTGAMISRLVRNERYCGDVLVRKTYTRDHLTHASRRNQGEKEQYLMKDHHAPIISREFFDKVQEVIRENQREIGRSGRKVSRPLSEILVCGECGRNFHVRCTARDFAWFCPTAECWNGKCLCHVQKMYESRIRQMVQAAVESRQEQESRKHYPERPNAGALPPRICTSSGVPDLVGKIQFIFHIFARMRAILEDDGFERRYAELKRIQTENAPANEGAAPFRTGCAGAVCELEPAASKSRAELEEELLAIENSRTEAEVFREYREKAIAWMQKLPGGEARWSGFLEGISGEYLRAFFIRITARQDGGCVFRWFDGVETEAAAPGRTDAESAW